MLKKINRFINSSILISALFIILGLILTLRPETSMTIITYTIAAFLIINGATLLIIDYRTITGILTLVFGLFLIFYPTTLSYLIPIILGIWFIISGVVKFRVSEFIKDKNHTNYIITTVIAILTIICGFFLVIRPTNSVKAITSITGLIIIIYALMDIINMSIIKKDINNIIKSFKKSAKKIIDIKED